MSRLWKAHSAAPLLQKLDPVDRPTVDSIRDDPFFASINFSNIWTDHIPDIKTGIAPPVKMVQQTLDFTNAFDAPESDTERDEIDLADEVDQVLISPKPGFERAPSTTSPTTEPKIPFPDHLVSGAAYLREPQRKWIEAGGNTFSSTETLEEAAARAKLRPTGGGPAEREGGLARKLTHQWEQEERRKLWRVLKPGRCVEERG
jgi:hypothetical protein